MKITELKNRRDVGLYLNANGLTNLGAEVGVAYGENACEILNKWQGSGLFLVDPWDISKCGEYIDGSANIDFDAAYNLCISKISSFPGRTIVLRGTSDEALGKIPDSSLDFVYIDGNHHDPQVSKDINDWYSKVKPGGLFGGHDYYNLNESFYRCDVKKAVDAFVKKKKLKLHVTNEDQLDQSWWIVVP
jgi:hypothetical protein